jgi:PAS domain S-box-containing protein
VWVLLLHRAISARELHVSPLFTSLKTNLQGVHVAYTIRKLVLTLLAIAALPLSAMAQGSPAQPQILTIAEARADANGDHILDRLGQTVTVSGYANVGTGILNPDRLQVFIQDDSGGIELYSKKLGTGIQDGDYVTATGVVYLHNGATELKDVEYEVVASKRRILQPINSRISEVLSEKYDATLVHVKGRIIHKGRSHGDYLTINNPDEDATTIDVGITSSHQGNLSFDGYSVGDTVEVTGALQRTIDDSGEVKGRIYLRYPSDIKVIGFSRSHYRTGLVIAGIGLVLILLWITLLQIQVKRRTTQLNEGKERYRLLFDGTPLPMWVFDRENLSFLATNDAAVHHYGYSRKEFLAMTTKDIMAGEDMAARPEEMIASDSPALKRVVTCSHQTKGGIVIEVEVTSHPLVFEGRPAELVLVNDVTERKKLEDQLRQSQKMEAVGQLAGGVAHDFNNLLTVISGYSDLALMIVDPSDPIRRKLEAIQKAGVRAASLTRQLLAFSRKQVLQPKALNLNDLITDTSKMLRRLIGEDIELVMVLKHRLGQVMADPSQMEQIFVNLAVNARDAMPHGGKLIIETTNVQTDEEIVRKYDSVKPGPHVRLTVTDTGCGIDSETQKHIFEPFFTTKGVGKGTGLGLSTVYGIVKQSGGFIAVYSEVGKGTTFKTYLPRVNDSVTEDLDTQLTQGVAPKGTETVLLVEDEEMVRDITRDVLEQSGYTVLVAADGVEALRMCKEQPGKIQLSLTDVVMPRMSGRQFAEQVKTLEPEMRVLYMSGYTDDAIVHHGVLDEGTLFIEKPFTADALARKVRAVLDA